LFELVVLTEQLFFPTTPTGIRHNIKHLTVFQIMVQPDTAEKQIGSQQEVVDFLQRAQAKLSEASGGFFFRTNNARLLPSFDRGSGDDDDADQKDSKEGKDHIGIAT
jgi:hypothetical protein